jgi:gas vesicle protein
MNEYDRYGDYTQQSQESSGKSNSADAVKYMLIGMGIGAVVALLLAPASGSEIRNAVRRRFRSTVDGLNDRAQHLKRQGSNLLGFSRRSNG